MAPDPEEEVPTVAEISRQLRGHVDKVHTLVQKISEVVDDLNEHAGQGIEGDYERVDRRRVNQPHEPERRNG